MASICLRARPALKTSAGASAASGSVGAMESVEAIATSTRAAKCRRAHPPPATAVLHRRLVGMDGAGCGGLARGHDTPVNGRLVTRAVRALRSHDTAANPASSHFSSRRANSDRTVSTAVALSASRYHRLPEARKSPRVARTRLSPAGRVIGCPFVSVVTGPPFRLGGMTQWLIDPLSAPSGRDLSIALRDVTHSVSAGQSDRKKADRAVEPAVEARG
jgi:hypothetical protein